MNSWPVATLNDVFAIARGGSPRPIDDYITDDPNGINWIMIGDAPEGAKYIERTRKRIRVEGAKRSRLVKPGDFLLSNSMSFGRPYIMKTSGCIHDGWLVLSPRRDDVDPDFLFRFLGSAPAYAELERRAAGVTVKNLNIDVVSGVPLPLPPLAEQRRIADILDRAEAMRAKRREAIGLLGSLSNSLFVGMFGLDGDREWPVRPVSDWVQTFETGKSVDPAEDGTPTRNRVLKVSAVTSLEFLPDESKPVPDEYDPPTSHFVRPADLLFSRANTRELIGATALVHDVASNVLLPDKLWRFVWREPRRVDPLFVQALFRTRAVRQTIGQRASGTSGSMKNIAQQKVLEMETMLPPIDLQHRFAERVAAIDKLRSAHRVSLAEMDALFSSLQHRAFRGEL